MVIEGLAQPGDWFFAKNSGRNFKDTDPFLCHRISAGRPLRLETSEQRRPEANEIKKAVFQDKNFKVQDVKGSKGEDLRAERTTKRSQAGVLLGDLWSLRDNPRRRSLIIRSSEKSGPPSCLMVEEMAERTDFTVEAESFLSKYKKARKLASWTEVGESALTLYLRHHRDHLVQWASYTEEELFLKEAQIESWRCDEAPSVRSLRRTSATRVSGGALGSRVECPSGAGGGLLGPDVEGRDPLP